MQTVWAGECQRGVEISGRGVQTSFKVTPLQTISSRLGLIEGGVCNTICTFLGGKVCSAPMFGVLLLDEGSPKGSRLSFPATGPPDPGTDSKPRVA